MLVNEADFSKRPAFSDFIILRFEYCNLIFESLKVRIDTRSIYAFKLVFLWRRIDFYLLSY
jgi:hypothetical protein